MGCVLKPVFVLLECWRTLGRYITTSTRSSFSFSLRNHTSIEFKMGRKDLFIIDTRNKVNESMTAAFESNGYKVKIASGFVGVPNEVLDEAAGYKALGMCSNRRIAPSQVEIMKENGNQLILCFGAGYDNIPLEQCKEAGIQVARVPKYSPASIAEYAVSSIMALAKNIQKSYELTKVADFQVAGLTCLLLEDKVAGVIGTGEIGRKTVEKLSGLVSKILCYDVYQSDEWIKGIPNAEYVPLEELLSNCHMFSIHVPLLPETHHLINTESISKMKDNAILVNTSRGEVVCTQDLLAGLKSGKIFGAALDVFEGESAFIWKDMTETGFKKHPVLKEMASMQNVIMSSHIAFYTDVSIRNITDKSLANYQAFLGKQEKDPKAFVV